MRTTAVLVLALGLALALAPSRVFSADALAELKSFSVFENVNLDELAKGDAETQKGPSMSNQRFLSVQSVYVVPGPPGKHAEALKQWNPTAHRELKVFLHSDLSGSPGPADFAKLQKAPDNSSVHALVSATEKMASELQISRDEAKKTAGEGGMSGGTGKFWTEILSARARSFASGGSAAQAPYDHTGENIRPNDELNALLKQQDKIRKQFSGFLGQTGIGRGAGSLTPDLYWELLDVDDQGVVTLGASYSRSGDTVQSADALYYASGGYYVALTLYQMWPVTAGGKPSTLVWRGDMISAPSLASLHGVERLASEGVMVKNISKAIALIRRDTGGR